MSRSLLNKTSELKDVNPVAGSSVSATDYVSTISLQVGGSGSQSQALTYSSMADGDVVTVTIGPDSGDTKTLTITLDATTGASDSAAATAIADEINAATKISNLVKAVPALGIVGLFGRQKGASATFYATSTVTGSGSVSVGSATSPTDATAIVPGCMSELSTATKVQGSADIGSAIGTGTYTRQVNTSEDLTSKSITTNDYVSLTISGDFDGEGVKSYTVDVVFRSAVDDTIDDLAKAMRAALPDPSVSVSVVAAGGVLTLTAGLLGNPFSVNGGFTESGTADVIDFTTTAPNAIPRGAGVALFSQTVEQNDAGVLEFGSGSELSSLQEGRVHVLLDSGVSVSAGDDAFVRIAATGSEQLGAFRNALDGTDCLPVSAFGFNGKFTGSNFTDMNGQNVAPLSISRT